MGSDSMERFEDWVGLLRCDGGAGGGCCVQLGDCAEALPRRLTSEPELNGG